MKTLLIYFIILAKGLLSQTNTDSLNKYNDKHKKTGLWTVYLDEFTNPTDREKSVFFGYELYDNGECIFPFSKYKGTKSYKIEFDGQKGEKGKPVILSGNIKLIYPSGKISYEAQYRNGRPVYQRAFRYDKKEICKMKELLDYENKYNNIDGTFYYELFGYDNKLFEHGYYRKGDKGWRVYKDKL